jgi:Dynamin family
MSGARTYIGSPRGFAGQEGDVSTRERDTPGVLGADPVGSYTGQLRAAADHAAAPPPPGNGAPAALAFKESVPDAAASAPGEDSDILDAVHAPTIKLMNELRQARHRLNRAALPELQLSPAIRALLRTERRLGRPLRVAICGEVNAGKSSLANLLAGIESLPTAVTTNTLIPTLLYYAAEPEIWAAQASGKRERLRSNGSLPRQAALRIEVGLPSPRLALVQVLDLPGFSDSRWGTPVVELAVHHVDATIWCTVSTQAWKESERSAWSMLSPRLGARSMLVATHRDLLHKPEDRQRVMARLEEEVGTAFASIVSLATIDAIAVMGDNQRGGAAWADSGAGALETALAALLVNVREQRAAAAQTMTGRIAQRALTRIEKQLGSATDGAS